MRLLKLLLAGSGPTLLALVLTAGSQRAAAFSLKHCDAPKVPIGSLRAGSGTLVFLVRGDGTVDTSSIGVVGHPATLSVAGLRSVATRYLSGCRFAFARGVPKVDTRAIGELRFDPGEIVMKEADLAPTNAALLDPEPFDLKPEWQPLGNADGRVEEIPRQLDCKPISLAGKLSAVKRPPPVDSATLPRVPLGQARAAAEARNAAAHDSRVKALTALAAGDVLGEVMIDARGVQDTIFHVLEAGGGSPPDVLVGAINACHYVVARYRGTPVSVMLRIHIISEVRR